jgi:hypothetical protein
MSEEIRGVTWDLQGATMLHWLMIRRLCQAGFISEKDGLGRAGDAVVLNMFAISEGESGGSLKAWHINVVRNDDGTIKRTQIDGKDTMSVRSIDMGSMQINETVALFQLEMDPVPVQAWVDEMFAGYPDLAHVDTSLVIAMSKFKADIRAGGSGYRPWYAYQPDTAHWRQKKRYGSKAFADYLIRTYVGHVDSQGNPTNYYPDLEFVR